MLVRGRLRFRCAIVAAAVVVRVLECSLFLRAREAWPRHTGVRLFLLPHLADPALKLIRVEMAVAAVGERSECAIRKREERRIGPPGGPRPIPRASGRAHARDAPAANQPHDINLMR